MMNFLLFPTLILLSLNFNKSERSVELTPENCELPAYLRDGEFFRQHNHLPSGPDYLTRVPTFEKLIFTKFTAFPWGRCASQVGPNSFIFRKTFYQSKSFVPDGAEFMIRPLCYRCFTLVQLTPNVVQTLYQNESICHKTMEMAELSCFDAQKVSPGEGTLLFRYLRLDSACELLQGKFQLGYNLKLELADSEEKPRKFECKMGRGSQMSSCAGDLLTDEITLSFRNCTFPDFEQKFHCLGSWPVKRNAAKFDDNGNIGTRFIALYNTQTQEFRCGILKSLDEANLNLFLSVDSSCARMTPDGENALEEFTMREYGPEHFLTPAKAPSNNFALKVDAGCEFPDWLRGRHFSNGLHIGQRRIEHRRPKRPAKSHFADPQIGANLEAGIGEGKLPEEEDDEDGQQGGQIRSNCVRQPGHERFLVHSAGKCGQPLGFHCLWFRARSEALVEFRTTGMQTHFDADICDSNQFSPWAALLDVDKNKNDGTQLPILNTQPKSAHCGLQGHFRTPKHAWLSGDCFSLEADCSRGNALRLVAFHCQNSRVYEISEYECLASWREGNLLFIYTQKINNSNSEPADGGFCFAIRESNMQSNTRGIEFALLGKNCKRQIHWDSESEDGDSEGEVLALEKKENCNTPNKEDATHENEHELQQNLILENFIANDDGSETAKNLAHDEAEIRRSPPIFAGSIENFAQKGNNANFGFLFLNFIFILFILKHCI